MCKKRHCMAQVINDRHLWLLGQFWNGASKVSSVRTLQEIKEKWYDDTNEELKDRTFHEHKKVLFDVLGVEITCNHLNEYSIANVEEIRSNPILQWTLDSLSVQNLVMNVTGIKDHIFLEEIPGGTMYLETIAKAIRRHFKMVITYQAFIKGNILNLIVYPYALKTYRRRWYMLAKIENESKLRNFALDRIQKLEYIPILANVGTQKRQFEAFKMPDASDIKDYYADAVGIWVEDNQKEDFVTIRAYGIQADYLRTLPWHHSQEEVSQTKEYTDFRFYVAVNPDLEREILARANEIEVLSPDYFRQRIKNSIERMAKRYSL